VMCPWSCTPLNVSRMVWFNCITAFRTILDDAASCMSRRVLLSYNDVHEIRKRVNANNRTNEALQPTGAAIPASRVVQARRAAPRLKLGLRRYGGVDGR